MKRPGISPPRPGSPTPGWPGTGNAADPEPSLEHKLHQALSAALWQVIGPDADDVVHPWMAALQGNELHLEDHSALLVQCVAPIVWEAYAELAAARGQGITSVFLPSGLAELPPGLAQLKHLSYLELPDCPGATLDCRWALHSDVGELTLALPRGKVTEILAFEACAIRCPGGHCFPIRVLFHDRESGAVTRAAKAQEHTYFRTPREFAEDGAPSMELQAKIIQTNLNGQAMFSGSGKPIVCTDLTYQWLCDRLAASPGRRFSYEGYRSVDRIEQRMALSVKEHYRRLIARGPGGLEERDQILRAVPFEGPLPHGPGGERWIGTTLLPAAHHSYFEVVHYVNADASAAQVAARLSGLPASDLRHLLDTDGDAPLLGLAAGWGRAHFVRGATQAILNCGELGPEQAIEILHDTDQGAPALYLALSKARLAPDRDYPGTIAALMECLVHPDVPAALRMQTLSFRNAEGRPLLHVAFDSCAQGRPASSLRAFVEPMLACDLEDEDKLALLSLPDATGTSALEQAARNEQNADAVAAFAAMVAGSGLGSTCKAKILALGDAAAGKALQAVLTAVVETAPSVDERETLLAALRPT